MLEKSGWLVRDRTRVYEEVDTKQSDFNSGKYKTVSQTLKDPEEHAYADYILLDSRDRNRTPIRISPNILFINGSQKRGT